MEDKQEKVYDSGTSDPNGDFWLEKGKEMVTGSFDTVHESAKAITTGIGLLQGIYVAILGFAGNISKTFTGVYKGIFLIPFLFWMLSLYASLQVVLARKKEINLNSPDDIRNKYEELITNKHKNIMFSYWYLTIGLAVAILLLLFPFI